MGGKLLNYDDVRDLIRVVNEVREHRDVQDRRRHLLEGLLRIVGGETAGLVDYTDAPTRGLPGANLVTVGFNGDEEREALALYNSAQGTLRNLAIPAIGERAAKSGNATFRREDMVADGEWYRSEYVETVRHRWRIDHSIYSVSLTANGAVGFSVGRAVGTRPFTEEQNNLVRLFHEVWGDLLRFEEEKANVLRQLTPRERETLHLILRGRSAKEIADEMAISVHTVNQYTKRVFALAGVKSRAQLMAKFGPTP